MRMHIPDKSRVSAFLLNLIKKAAHSATIGMKCKIHNIRYNSLIIMSTNAAIQNDYFRVESERLILAVSRTRRV